jgi:hypothetical protein
MNFDLEPGNIDIEMANDPNIRGQEEEEKTKMTDEQEITSTDPPDQA